MADDFEFRAFMLQVSRRMTSDDFGQLKYLLKGYVSNAKCEEIKAVCDYFEELHRMCLLSATNFGVLKTALGFIGRQDLVEDIEQKEQYFANLFKDKREDSLAPKEYDAVCDGITEAAGKLKPFPRSGQNAAELQNKLQLTSLENEGTVQLEEISDILGISDMSTALTDLRKENKEVKKGNGLPLKKDEWSVQSKRPDEMRTGGGDEQGEVKPSLHMDNAESMEIPIEDTVQSNSSENAMEAEDHQLESKTTEQALSSVEKITLSTENEKEPIEDTVPDCDELEDLNSAKDQIKYSMTDTSSPQPVDDVVTDGKENDKGITADSKKDEIKATSNKAKHQDPQHPHGPGARPKEPLFNTAKTADTSGADKQMATEQANEAKHQGPQHPHGPGARPKEPLSKKAKTADTSGDDKQMATEQADEVSETNLHGKLFVELLLPEKTGSKEPIEDEHSEPWNPPTGEIFSCDGNESDDLYSSHEDESTKYEQPKTSMHGPGQGASTTASKGPHLCYHPPGIFSTPLDSSGYSGHPTCSGGNYSFPELIMGESTMDGQGQGACATTSKQPLGCHYPPGVFFSNPTNQKASDYSDHAVPGNFSLFELMQIASAVGMNIEPSNQLELLEKLQALQTSVSYAQGSSTYNAAAADSSVRSNCYSKAGYSVVITNGDLCESTSEKGVFMMESGIQFCIVIANNNNYAAEVDITFGGMWLGAWVVEAKQSLSTPLVIEGSSWAPGRLKFFSASDARKPQPSVDIYGDQPDLNGRIELEFKPESKILKVYAKHVRRNKLFEISIIETKTTTVGDLKQEIRKKLNSDISCLLKGGEVLQEEKTISSYALNENEVIEVLNAMEELMIETPGKDPVTMMVDPRNVSVEAVKDFIAKNIRIPKEEQILRFKGQDTDVDFESLTQMFLTSKQAPVLKVDKDQRINVIVVLPNREGEEKKVEINLSATVEDLKEKLEERGICDTTAKLRFDDQEISGQGGKKLIDLRFKNKSKIIVSQTRSSTLRGFSGSSFDGFRGSGLRGFGGFRGFSDSSSSPSALRGFPEGTRAFRNGPEDAEDYSSEYHGEEGVAVLHGTEENVHKNFQIDTSGQKFAKEKAVTLVIELIAKSMGAAGAAAAASSQSSVPPGAYYSGGPTGPMSTPTPPPVPD